MERKELPSARDILRDIHVSFIDSQLTFLSLKRPDDFIVRKATSREFKQMYVIFQISKLS